MGWESQVGASAGFLAVGVWHAYGGLKSRLGMRLSIKAFDYRDVENCVIIAVAMLHILWSWISSSRDQKMGYPVASVMVLERCAVAAGFLLYALLSLLREKTRLLPIPREFVQFVGTAAFSMEFLLFYLRDYASSSEGLVDHYHGLLLVPIGVCIISSALEIAYPLNALIPMIQSMALILQGSWFVQMTLSFFSKWIAHGCWVDEKGEGDYRVNCEKGMALMRAKAISTLQFNLHLALLLLLFFPTYAFVHRRIKASASNYERLVEEEVREMSQIQMNGHQTYVIDENE